MKPKRAPLSDDSLIGRQLSNFLVKRVLGRGGMAQVYYGEDVKLKRPVAIKVIDVRFRNQPAYAQRFVQEARAVASWRHENLIQIYYADDQDGFYYYVMEYIDGDDLSHLISSSAIEGQLLPAEEILRLGRAIASALDYAHSQGVVHRDVKPSNILLSKAGRVVLSDFGLALDLQQGSAGEAFGTPHYISPEQASRSTDAVPQSDLYSLGVMLYEMLTGVVPFDDASPTNVALQHITQPPPPPRSLNPQLNAETEAVLLKALSKKPKDRYQTGAALIEALAKALAKSKLSAQRVLPLPPMPAAIVAGKTRNVTQRPPQLPTQTALKKPRRLGWLLVIFLLGILLGGGYFFRSTLFPGGFDPLTFFSILSPTPTPTAPRPFPKPVASTALPPVVATATGTASPTHQPTVTKTATVTVTATSLPSQTSTLTTTVTATQTVTPIADAPVTATLPVTPEASATQAAATPTSNPGLMPSPTTTQQYLNYKRLWLYYDAYGLYLYNASDANRSISPLAFERLDLADQPLNRFDGWRWADFFPTLQTGGCMQIEIQNNPNAYLNPAVCKKNYLSRRSFTAQSEFIFWTALPNSTQFRVLWQNQEVGRCEISAGFCEVFVP
jgi:serine/threonine protein kinase